MENFNGMESAILELAKEIKFRKNEKIKNIFEIKKEKIIEMGKLRNKLGSQAGIIEYKMHENDMKIHRAIEELLDIKKIPLLDSQSDGHGYALSEGKYYLITNDNINLEPDTYIYSDWEKVVLRNSKGEEFEIPGEYDLIREHEYEKIIFHFSWNPDQIEKYTKDNINK